MRTPFTDENPYVKVDWIFEQHRKTNHLYDGLPYEYHLIMTAMECERFQHLLGDIVCFHQPKDLLGIPEFASVILATCAHDTIEDTRVTYNDVVKALGVKTGDIVFACTELRGKNRAERHGEEYYRVLRETPHACFVKLCDIISNVKHSKTTKSRMFELYKKEFPKLKENMGSENLLVYGEMFFTLKNLYDEN